MCTDKPLGKDMEDKEYIDVFYPNWMKYLGLAGIPLLAMVAGWLATRFLWEPDLTATQLAVSTALGTAGLYQCLIGARCLPYLNTVITLYDDSVDIHDHNHIDTFKWEELVIKEYSFAATTQIRHKDGRTLAYLSDGLPNLELMKEIIYEVA